MLGCLFEIVETLVLTLIIFLVIQTFVAQPYKVQQQSMEHTLEPDQYVLVDKLTPRFDTYKRGDIVVFTPPDRLGAGGRDAVHQAGHRRSVATPSRSATAWSSSTGPSSTSRTCSRPARRSAAADDRPRRRAPLGHPRRRAVPDGRPPRQFGRLADRSGRSRRRQVIGRAWLRYWPLDVFGILPTPTYPELAPTPSMSRPP